ncbi:MAG: hypothetical protein CSA55_03520 [Ilumatobacter coccineus]|uniref:Uncharacterized protein n=1 Tax=Ilumatobacter coccineus TaxID=467094 RepID=A0A2G6KC58_9ACTN|nr:MAG: hypothetical protein CSA55_03520 [Ilumatobacter coccineus]
MADYTLAEQDQIRDALTAAYAAVANAQTTIFGRRREYAAAVRAMAALPPSLGGVFAAGDDADDGQLPDRPVTELVAEAKAIIAARQPEAVADFVKVVIGLCEDVAAAAGGVSAGEQAVIDRITAALN